MICVYNTTIGCHNENKLKRKDRTRFLRCQSFALDFSSLIFIFPSIPSYLTFSPSQVPVTLFFPFSPSSFFVDTTLFNFYSFHLLILFTIKSEPFHSSIIVPSYISYINHFPYCQKHYLPFLPILINFTYSLSFSLLSIFITYLRLQTLCSSPNHFIILLHSVPTSLSTSFVDHLS